MYRSRLQNHVNDVDLQTNVSAQWGPSHTDIPRMQKGLMGGQVSKQIPCTKIWTLKEKNLDRSNYPSFTVPLILFLQTNLECQYFFTTHISCQCKKNSWYDDLVKTLYISLSFTCFQFWSVFVQCNTQYLDSVRVTLDQFDTVKRFVDKYDDDFMFVTQSYGRSGCKFNVIGIS